MLCFEHGRTEQMDAQASHLPDGYRAFVGRSPHHPCEEVLGSLNTNEHLIKSIHAHLSIYPNLLNLIP